MFDALVLLACLITADRGEFADGTDFNWLVMHQSEIDNCGFQAIS
jgi:hypothetical protein